MSKDKNGLQGNIADEVLDKPLSEEIPEARLDEYRDPVGLSMKKIKFGLWLAENRKRIIKITTIALILVCAGLFIFSTYHFIAYFRSGDPSEGIVVDNINISPRQLTEDLKVSPVEVFASNSRYDLAVEINNPNEKFLATFGYCFSQGETDVFCSEGFILPSDKKYVLSLGRTDLTGLDNIKFRLTNVFWQRINPHKVNDWPTYASARLNFAISDIKFEAASDSGLSDKVNLGALSFKIKNSTSFGYYEVPLSIALYEGSELVGVNRYYLSDFLSGETREVKISWPGSPRSANRVVVTPEINIVDDSVYLKYQGN